ncbi:MAG: UbiA-like polyprenyltransferase [Rikenellaceae bacterium]
MIKKYLNLVKFSHTIFAMPFALIGLVYGFKVSDNKFSLTLFIAVVLCMIFARNAAMAFNRYIDRDIDSKNVRTAVREIPAGVISPRKALIFTILNCILFVATTLFINKLTLYLSPVALIVALGYSLTKRFTWLCHVFLGLALAIAPTAAYISVTGEFSIVTIIISTIVMFWTAGFDILYALQDKEFDASNKLFSIPSYFGIKNALIISALFHLTTITFVFYLYFTVFNSYIYLIGAILYSSLLVYEHIIVKPNDISRVNMAFATANGLGSVIFAIFTILAIVFHL